MSNYHYLEYRSLHYSYSKLEVIEPSDTEIESDFTTEVSADLTRWRIALMWLIYGLRFGFQHPGIQRLQVNI